MQPMFTLPTPIATPTPNPARALRRLWLICWIVILTVAIGRAWDGWWHITQPFDGFWSPPHVFVYVMSTIAGLLTARVAWTPELRRCFGSGFCMPIVPFRVPGPLFLLGSGFVALGIAGIYLDNLWHTLWGLDETPWSLPHAMIGAALLVMTWGFVACRLALRLYTPIGRPAKLLLGFLLVSTIATPLGPLFSNSGPEMVRAVANIPVLAAQPEAQRGFDLQIDWNLTRTHPAAVVLCAAWAGAALSIARVFSRRARYLLAVALVWTLLSYDRNAAAWLNQFYPVLDNPANWQPLPLLPAAVVFALAQRFVAERWAWTIAGGVFGLLMAATWGVSPLMWLLMPLAAPAAALGAELGAVIARALEQPSKARAWRLVLIGVLGVPLTTGTMDLVLRLFS